MMRRRQLLIPNVSGYPHDTFSFTLDGNIHISNILIPAKNITILTEVGGQSGGATTSAYVDTDLYANNTNNRYFTVSFYSNYAYVDCGGKRTTMNTSQGYNGSVTNRFAITVDDLYNYITYCTTQKTSGATTTLQGLTDIGYLRGNRERRNTGVSVTAYVYYTSLPDEVLYAYITDGIIP